MTYTVSFITKNISESSDVVGLKRLCQRWAHSVTENRRRPSFHLKPEEMLSDSWTLGLFYGSKCLQDIFPVALNLFSTDWSLQGGLRVEKPGASDWMIYSTNHLLHLRLLHPLLPLLPQLFCFQHQFPSSRLLHPQLQLLPSKLLFLLVLLLFFCFLL